MANPPVHGQSGSGSGLDVLLGILGVDGGYGVWGDSDVGAGVLGTSASNAGVYGVGGNGVVAVSTQFSAIFASSDKSFGVYAEGGTDPSTSAVHGESSGGAGVSGRAVGVGSGPGVVGVSDSSFGVRGQSGDAVLIPPVGGGGQFQICGVQGTADNGTGVRGDGAMHVGVRGRSLVGDGVFGSCQDLNEGKKTVQTTGNGIHGQAPRSSPDANTGPFAGLFQGDVKITGNLYVGGTRIQSVLAGVVTLDAKGKAVVALPERIADLGGQICYQLTPVGAPGPNLHIAEEVKGNKFRIAGGAGESKVSWHVTVMAEAKPAAVTHPGDAIGKDGAREHRRQMQDFAKQIEKNKRHVRRKR